MTPSDLERHFADPPRGFSPVPIWWWSGERLDPARLRWQLERFVQGGVYNLIILNLAPTGPLYGCDADDPPFFSEEWWRIFRGVCADARELGVRLWFYDQFGFSGANLQATLVTRQPAYAGRSLERVAREVEGTAHLACPAASVPIAGAYLPLNADGSVAGAPIALPIHERAARWDGGGRGKLMLAYSVERAFDYFNPAACRALLEAVHGAFEERVGDYFGDVIVGSFQDELSALPTWSGEFEAAFRARCGYDLAPRAAALWEDYGDEARRVRRDYHATRAALAEDAFFRPLHAWHEQRGLLCGFDQQGPARAGHPVESVALYADYPRTHRWYTAPGSDHHGDARIHSSLAHLYDRPRVWIEAFHSSGWGGTLEETFDWLLPWLRAGANLYDPHAVYYSTRGGWWEWAPPATDWRQPYWKHYGLFAQAVSRLCAILSQGHHVCDVGVLFPTTTVQAGLRLNGADEEARAAHESYLRLVGAMFWNRMQPGVLDQARRDYDVLDDASVQRGQVRDGRLHIGQERYAALVLPGCTALEPATAAQLIAFVEGGGLLVAVGQMPRLLVGEEGDAGAARALAALFRAGRAHAVGAAEEVGDLIAGLPSAVEAPVPTLLRRVGASTILFVPAAFPRATRMAAEQGGAATVDWRDVAYTFDPAAYSRTMTIRVRGVQGQPEIWEPFSGRRRPLAAHPVEGGVQLQVPFDDSPGVLVIWRAGAGPIETARGEHAGSAPIGVGTRTLLPERWTTDLEPTLDNRWGDLALPASTNAPAVERWRVRHMTDPTGHDGLDQGWFRPEWDDAHWPHVVATFGPHGLWAGPATPEGLPAPSATPDEPATAPPGAAVWQPAIYSPSRGIYKDRLHRRTLGPKGHIPEEFLDFGRVRAGEAVQFRALLTSPEPRAVHLALGAPARKWVWLNGEAVDLAGRDAGYLTMAPVALRAGRNLIEFRLQPEEELDLRAHVAFVADPERYRRPEWMQAAAGARKDSLLVYARRVAVPFRPRRGVIQVGAAEPCRVRVNGVEVGRQGAFDPYFSLATPRIQPYDMAKFLHEGDNLIEIEIIDLGAGGCLLADALIEGEGTERVTFFSDATWHLTRDGREAPVGLRRAQWLDPSHAHLWRRPHPLPSAGWLEQMPADEAVLPLVPAARARGGVEWLRFLAPPGAMQMRLRLHGAASVYVDGEEQAVSSRDAGGSTHLTIDLPRPDAVRRLCAVRIETLPGYEAGGALEAPIRFEMTTGTMTCGAWEEQGLAEFSGGVHYSQTIACDAEGARRRAVLDLGHVRGTAEVSVNGVAVGTRIWSPYVFDLTGYLHPGENALRITVYNTLAPYMDAVSPTFYVFPGQAVSGLLGPVALTTYDI